VAGQASATVRMRRVAKQHGFALKHNYRDEAVDA
jgi:hypothetical protein